MLRLKEPQGILTSFRHVLSHGMITLLAIGVAFALPAGAQYILYYWWPRVEASTHTLLATEIAVASVLVLLFNVTKMIWDHRHHVAGAKLASLVFARSNAGWLSRWTESKLSDGLPAAREVSVLTVTGFDSFTAPASPLRPVLDSAFEIRVMLLNPASHGAQLRAASPEAGRDAQAELKNEIRCSVDYLRSLRKAGRKVSLKFYDHPPFWNLAIVGEHAWVQYCYRDCASSRAPEYVFALNPRDPKRGLYVPFCMHFLEKWNESWHPEYDFDRNELVYRSAAGHELKRRAAAIYELAVDHREPVIGAV